MTASEFSPRKGGTPQSLANAFVRPVRPSADKSLLEASVEQLEAYLDKTFTLWNDPAEVFACAEVDLTASQRPKREPSFDQWVRRVVQASGGVG